MNGDQDGMITADKHYIDGAWVAGQGGKPFPIMNPATEAQIGTVTLGSAADVDLAVAAANLFLYRSWNDFCRLAAGAWSQCQPSPMMMGEGVANEHVGLSGKLFFRARPAEWSV